MKPVARRSLVSLTVLIGVLVAGIYALVATSWGLQLTVSLTRSLAPGSLSVQQIEGRLIGPIRLDGLEYHDSAWQITLHHLDVDWKPAALLDTDLHITRLALEGLAVDQLNSGAPAAAGFDYAFPVTPRIDELELRNIQIHQAGAVVMSYEAIDLAFDNERRGQLRVQEGILVTPDAKLQVNGGVGIGTAATEPLTISWLRPHQPSLSYMGALELAPGKDRIAIQFHLHSPSSAELNLTLDNWRHTPTWHGHLELAVARLADYYPGWPEKPLAGSIQASGDLNSLHLEAALDTRIDADQSFPINAEISLSHTRTRWQLSHAVFNLPTHGSRLQLTGEGEFEDSAAITLNWQHLRWPLATKGPIFSSDQGTLTIEGKPAAYQYSINGQTRFPAAPVSSLSASGRGGPDHLIIEKLQLDSPGGMVRGQGELNWRAELQWDTTLFATAIDPAFWLNDWPGQLDGRITSRGTYQSDQFSYQLMITDIAGNLRGFPVGGNATLTGNNSAHTLKTLNLTSGAATLTASGSLDDQWQGHWQVAIPSISSFSPSSRGSVRGHGSVTGPMSTPHLQASIAANQLSLSDIQAATLAMDWETELTADPRFSLNAQGTGVSYKGYAEGNTHLMAQGSLKQHQVSLAMQSPLRSISMAVQGGITEEGWGGIISQSRYRDASLDEWQLDKPAEVQLGLMHSQFAPACWIQRQARFCLEGHGNGADGWKLLADLEKLPVRSVSSLYDPEHQVTGQIDAHLALGLEPAGKPRNGTLQITLSPGELTLPGNPDLSIPYEGGKLQAELDNDRLTVTTNLALIDEDRLTGQLQLSTPFSPDPTLSGEIRGSMRNWLLFEPYLQTVQINAGSLDFVMHVDGALSAPRYAGSLRIQEGNLTVLTTNVTYHDINLQVAANDSASLQVTGGMLSDNDGRMHIEGEILNPLGKNWSLAMTSTGENLQILNTRTFRVKVDPALEFAASQDTIRLNGKLHIPEARLQPRDLSAAVRPSPDTVKIQADATDMQAETWKIFTDIQLSLGDAVWFDGYGLKGFIRGELRLLDEPSRPTMGRGVLEVAEGYYRAYGQDLKIDTGRLIYTDTPLENPGLDIRAARHVQDITAGIRVIGQLNEPSISLYSDPVLSETDTLSYLLLGRPMRQASSSEGTSLMQAASIVGLSGGEHLAGQIGDYFGVDEVEIGGNGGLEDAALMVGKYLSPRLYVRYSVGLLEPISTFHVRYKLSRRWSVQTETGPQSGADIVYTLE